MIIPILHIEKELQLKDMTRIDASVSTLVKGSADPIDSVIIKPGADGAEIEVFNSNPKNWFVDFMFSSYAFDVDATNDALSFEVAGVEYDTNLTTATYTLANLLLEIKSKIEAEVVGLTATLSLDDRNRITISGTSEIKILLKTSLHILTHLGFSKDGQTLGTPVEYGLRKITLTISADADTATISEYIKVYTPEGDALFSHDSDLVAEENDIMKWLPKGRGSYLNLHRTAQRLIVDFMDRNGYRDDNQDKITKHAFVDNSDVNQWSKYLTLRLFFKGASNASDDVFKDKAKHYEKLEIESRNRAVLSLDLDGDGKKDATPGPSSWSGSLFLR